MEIIRQGEFGIRTPVSISVPCPNPPAFPGCVIVYAAVDGNVSLSLPGKKLLLKPDDVCLLGPGLPHDLGEKGEVVCVAMEQALLYGAFVPMLADCPLLLEFVFKCRQHPSLMRYLFFSHYEGETIRPLLERVASEFRQRRKSYQSAVVTALGEWFVLLMRNYHVREPREGLSVNAKLDMILGYLCEDCASATLESTARRFHYHPNTISAILSRNLGKHFSEVMRDIRLERACSLLAQSSLPVNEIAFLCGYEHMTNFYNLFKRQYGMTPKTYRDRAPGRPLSSSG